MFCCCSGTDLDSKAPKALKEEALREEIGGDVDPKAVPHGRPIAPGQASPRCVYV